MRLPVASLCAAALALLACSGNGPSAGPPGVDTACTYTNPLGTGADPWVVRHDGAYYLIESREGGIWVYRSTQLTSPKRNAVKVWTAPDTGWNRAHVWAPELHRVGNRWYIYYAAGRAGPPFIHQRSGVLESVTDDPQGAYVDRGMLYTGDDVATGADPKWAIDVTIREIAGQLYAVWSGWEQNATTDRTPQHLYIARMTNPWTIGSDRVKISSPVESWERGTELDLQEGAQFLESPSGQLFLIYSTRESWLKEYRLGQLRLASPTADPMDPASWIKSGPVFAGTAVVHGTGHASFTVSPDGTEHWIVYHTKVSTTPGWERVIHAQKFGWNADGSPNFGTPVGAGERRPVPSGQCQR